MMYPYMTLNDDTEITHSEMYPDGKVKVYIETPDETGGFYDAICWLPDYTWEVHGYSESEMMYFKQLIRDNARNNKHVENLVIMIGYVLFLANICKIIDCNK